MDLRTALSSNILRLVPLKPGGTTMTPYKDAPRYEWDVRGNNEKLPVAMGLLNEQGRFLVLNRKSLPDEFPEDLYVPRLSKGTEPSAPTTVLVYVPKDELSLYESLAENMPYLKKAKQKVRYTTIAMNNKLLDFNFPKLSEVASFLAPPNFVVLAAKATKQLNDYVAHGRDVKAMKWPDAVLNVSEITSLMTDKRTPRIFKSVDIVDLLTSSDIRIGILNELGNQATPRARLFTFEMEQGVPVQSSRAFNTLLTQQERAVLQNAQPLK